jgi:hypothetical protein
VFWNNADIHTAYTQGKLPPVLHLQLDNTSKQCKSKYILGFLALLVEYGVFEKVTLNFLPVGHTHEDIDQIFSRLAVYLRRHNARNADELLECLRKSYTPTHGGLVHTEHMPTNANISDWLQPCLASMAVSNAVSADSDGIFKWHHFVMTKHTLGPDDTVTVMQVNTTLTPAHTHPTTRTQLMTGQELARR